MFIFVLKECACSLPIIITQGPVVKKLISTDRRLHCKFFFFFFLFSTYRDKLAMKVCD